MKIAGVQMDVELGKPDSNLANMIEKMRETTSRGAVLTVFPECALTGYCFDSHEAAREFGQTIPGPATEKMTTACAETQSHVIFGMLESAGEDLFNAAVLIGPQGVIGSYRKVHLPFLGVDMFTSFGDRPFAVHSAGELKVGMNICYDAAFPEAARCLALAGADLIVLPTNWPPGAECTAASAINTRALENGVYYMAVNRVGTEAGFSFIGRSRIADPTGATIAESKSPDEEILYADIDLGRARNKHYIRVPGKHEINRMADRRPEMYGPITEPHDLLPPGRSSR